MVRPLYSITAVVASLGAALTLSSTAHAESFQLTNNCVYDTGEDCTTTCSSATINCSADSTKTCSSETCSDAGVTDTCTSACEQQCATTAGPTTCSDYCSAQCSGGCSAHDNCGAASSADCETDCSAQCSYECTTAPATTSCATACATSCQVVDNIQCTVMCQVTNNKTCTVTPELCSKNCNATLGGGAIVCNGEIVDSEASVADAVSWYVEHIDATFSGSIAASFSAMVTGSIAGSTTTTTTTGDGGTTTTKTTSTKCSASPISSNTGTGGFLLAGLSFVGLGVMRRRNRRGA
jgi:hypothetical protein